MKQDNMRQSRQTTNSEQRASPSCLRRLGAPAAVMLACFCPIAANRVTHAARLDGFLQRAALYPEDHRRTMRAEDYDRFPGAGILFCRGPDNVPRKAAASWLIGSPRLVMMNAHNFRGRRAEVTRDIADCFFQIAGRNYEFDTASVRYGFPSNATALHITDDWVLVRLRRPVEARIPPQPLPAAPASLPTGPGRINITMVSPAGHANLKTTSSIETCHIAAIDPPSEDGIRRARHNCNDGFGGSGSGLFDEAGRLVAMQSASLDMNRRLPFDIDSHYGSALLIEGTLLDALRRDSGG